MGQRQTDGRVDPLVAAPQVYRVVFENERVRVLAFETKPGDSWPLHGHPDSVVVSLTEYSVRNVIPGQPPTERHTKPGDVRWISATQRLSAWV